MKIQKISGLLLIGLYCSSTPSFALNKDSFGFWNQDLVQGNFGFLDSKNPDLKKFKWWAEGQIRVFDQLDRISQGLARSAAGYAINDKITLWAGYTWNPSRFTGHSDQDEHDLFPAITYVTNTSLGTFSARTMYEARFLQGQSQTTYRYRQLFRFVHPLEFEPRLSLVAWDEIFVNTNKTSWAENGFDQNRGFAGIGWNFTKNVRTDIGYFNWRLHNKDGSKDTTRHMMAVNFLINF
jgi:hypothetical protein